MLQAYASLSPICNFKVYIAQAQIRLYALNMITFYQVKGITPALEDAMLPELLSKMRAAGHSILLQCPTIERMERLNSTLWSTQPTSFIPHGTAGDGHLAHHPIFLTTELTNPNQATTALAIGTPPNFQALQKILPHGAKIGFLFNQSESSASKARIAWKALKETTVQHQTPCQYFAQTENGWQKKA